MIFGIAAAAVVTGIAGWITGILGDAVSKVGELAKGAGRWCVELGDYPNGAVLIPWAVLFGWLIVAVVRSAKRRAWNKFTRAVYGVFLYSWEYADKEATDVHSRCLIDLARLIYSEDGMGYEVWKCPDCERLYWLSPDHAQEVTNLVQRDVETGKWRSRMEDHDTQLAELQRKIAQEPVWHSLLD